MSDNSFDYTHSGVVKCESCGADMTYDPALGKLSCAYCNSTRDVEKRVPHIRDFLKERVDGYVENDDSVYKCPNCGGQVALGGFKTATDCPFCGATNIVKVQDIKGLKPDSILPFKLPKQKACAYGKRWLKYKPFVPTQYKKHMAEESFKGVYIPSFAFNSDSYSTYEGRLGERRTRTVGTGKNRHTETYIYWYRVSGSDSRTFVNTMIEASPQIQQKELDKLLPFDVDFTEAYTKEYLAGFSAERYNASLDESFDVAKRKMDDAIRNAIIARYHADVVDYLNVNTRYDKIKFRYTMLPLWICARTFKKKLYRVIVNGRTGKATGNLPVSGVKVGALVVACIAVLTTIALLICHYMLGII